MSDPTQPDTTPDQSPAEEVEIVEMPIREDDAVVEAPVPKRVTREVESTGSDAVQG